MAGLLGQLRMRQEAEGADAVVEGDDDHALLGQGVAVADRHVAAAFVVGAAIDPEHHRKLLAGLGRRGPDVQVEAVLRHLRRIRQVDRQVHAQGPRLGGRLDAGVAPLGAVAHAAPVGGGLGIAPAQRTHRRGGEGDAAEHGHAGRGAGRAGHQAVDGLDRLVEGGLGRGGGERRARQGQGQRRGAGHQLHSHLLLSTLAPAGSANAMYWFGPGLGMPKPLVNRPLPPTGMTMNSRPPVS